MEFKAFEKIPRLSRECVITEKIDGTNASIYIGSEGEFLIGSRTRWITPVNDNHGFARWATEHKDELMQLGEGQHFGEWWGSGIQRGYGLVNGDKRFSLFNTGRWSLYGHFEMESQGQDPRIAPKAKQMLPKCCGLVPALYTGIFSSLAVEAAIIALKERGSVAAPGYMNPEGVVIYHTAARSYFKKTIEKDGEPKGKI